jgi:hypothetical protein
LGLQSIFLLCASNFYQIIKYFFFIIIVILATNTFAVAQKTQGVIGLQVQLGSHFQKIGLQTGATLQYQFFQSNLLATTVYNFKSLGPKEKFLEAQLAAGIVLGFGKKYHQTMPISFFHENYNSITNDWKIAYAYKMYLDARGTSQPTGTIALQYQRWTIVSQNDGFAFNPLDEFRTGTFQLFYTDSLVRLGGNIVLWTGASKNGIVIKDSLSRKLLYDITNNKYGSFSAGLAYLSAAYALPFRQHVFVQIGVDNEKIRNFFQNQMIHNNKWIHKLVPKINDKEILMLDKNGIAFRKNSNQILKPKKAFWHIGCNGPLAY